LLTCLFVSYPILFPKPSFTGCFSDESDSFDGGGGTVKFVERVRGTSSAPICETEGGTGSCNKKTHAYVVRHQYYDYQKDRSYPYSHDIALVFLPTNVNSDDVPTVTLNTEFSFPAPADELEVIALSEGEGWTGYKPRMRTLQYLENDRCNTDGLDRRMCTVPQQTKCPYDSGKIISLYLCLLCGRTNIINK